MFRNRTLKVLSNLFLMVALCIGQVAAAPYNGANEAGRNPSSPNSSISVDNNPTHAPEFSQQALMTSDGISFDSSGTEENGTLDAPSISDLAENPPGSLPSTNGEAFDVNKLLTETSLPANWVGGAVVTANKNIVAVGRPHIGAEVATYNGF